jgi:hypothetical protein
MRRQPTQGFPFGADLGVTFEQGKRRFAFQVWREKKMKNKRDESESAREAQFELKYCERCGGLWLRPMGGAQIYCVRCSREMAKLPPSYQAENGIERDADWDEDEEAIYGCDREDLDPDTMEGAA